LEFWNLNCKIDQLVFFALSMAVLGSASASSMTKKSEESLLKGLRQTRVRRTPLQAKREVWTCGRQMRDAGRGRLLGALRSASLTRCSNQGQYHVNFGSLKWQQMIKCSSIIVLQINQVLLVKTSITTAVDNKMFLLLGMLSLGGSTPWTLGQDPTSSLW